MEEQKQHSKTSYGIDGTEPTVAEEDRSLSATKPDFWPVSKNNTGSLPLRGNPAGNKYSDKQHIFAPTAGARCTIFQNFAR